MNNNHIVGREIDRKRLSTKVFGFSINGMKEARTKNLRVELTPVK